jgi:amino acid/peptide transporter (Peptide:H+ symporter), bacterial
MWERFSYYGMRAILLFYMYYAVSKGGLGFDQATAASIMSIYGSLVYMSGVVGGWLSDRVWGSRRTVFFGGVLIMFGHIALSLPFGATALFVSIALIVVGTGLLKPNVSEMVGGLYSETDHRRDAGFSMFVFGINLGAAVSPWAVPFAANGFGFHAFGNTMNFHAGFSLAAIGMFLGLIQYYFDGKKYLSKDSLYPQDPIEKENLRPIIIWSVIGVIALAAIIGLLGLTGNLNIDNVFGLSRLLPLHYQLLLCYDAQQPEGYEG